MTEYTYVIRRALAGAGREMWRRSVQCGRGSGVVAQGTNITSEEAAKADAPVAIERLARQRPHR
jgi:hypothetical protein